MSLSIDIFLRWKLLELRLVVLVEELGLRWVLLLVGCYSSWSLVEVVLEDGGLRVYALLHILLLGTSILTVDVALVLA